MEETRKKQCTVLNSNNLISNNSNNSVSLSLFYGTNVEYWDAVLNTGDVEKALAHIEQFFLSVNFFSFSYKDLLFW